MLTCHAEGRVGPISKAELKQAFARGQAGVGTPFWAAGMAEPQPLASIRELRWLVSHRLGTQTTQPQMTIPSLRCIVLIQHSSCQVQLMHAEPCAAKCFHHPYLHAVVLSSRISAVMWWQPAAIQLQGRS